MDPVVRKIRKNFIDGTLCSVANDDDVLDVKERFPKLYEMVTSNRCDDTMLNHMLLVYGRVERGHISQEKGDETFGEHAAKRYVYPLIDEKQDK